MHVLSAVHVDPGGNSPVGLPLRNAHPSDSSESFLTTNGRTDGVTHHNLESKRLVMRFLEHFLLRDLLH